MRWLQKRRETPTHLKRLSLQSRPPITRNPPRGKKRRANPPQTRQRSRAQRSRIRKGPQMSSQRLQKIIAGAGIASRRKAEELITAGRVTVNGEIKNELGSKADS